MDVMQTTNGNSSENPPVSVINELDDVCDTYHIKWIDWLNEKTPIITQNKNGPCPLLAIFNVLLLSKRINLSNVLEMISSKQIIDYIGTLMYDDIPDDLTDEEKLNYEQMMSDAFEVFSKLQTGIDVNVKFKNVTSFEWTSEVTVFDVLRISLYHGWLPDPQDEPTYSALSDLSYNQVVDMIINSKDSSNEDLVHKGVVSEHFISSTASQLTYYGVVKILETMKDRQLAVFFRNNHFSTIYKNQNELFTLVTDQGFLSKPNIVWETLSSVQGDTHFTDSTFHTAPLELSPDVSLSKKQQIEQDYQVALLLQDPKQTTIEDETTPTDVESRDHEMALRLQQQYDKRQQRTRSLNPRTGPQLQQTIENPPHQEKSNRCCIL